MRMRSGPPTPMNKSIPEGKGFFEGGHARAPRDFGFTGSMERRAAPPFAADVDTRGPKRVAAPTEAGGGDYAQGGSAVNNHIVRTTPYANGGVVCHHANGGRTIVHPDGRSERMATAGFGEEQTTEPRQMAGGGEFRDDYPSSAPASSQASSPSAPISSLGERFRRPGAPSATPAKAAPKPVVRRAAPSAVAGASDERRGTADGAPSGGFLRTETEKVIPNSAARRDQYEAPGSVPYDENSERYVTGAARGGSVGFAQGGKARLPTGMKAKVLQRHSPINTAPRNPMTTRTPRDIMPGGQMGYGVQPSAEPDVAGTTQNIPQLAGGGRMKR